MKTYRFAITFAAFLVSTVVSVQAASKQPGALPDLDRRVNVSTNQPEAVSGKPMRVNTRLPRISRHLRARLANMLARGCGCAAEEFDNARSCWTACMSSWGVNATTIIACTGTCVAAGTGNPIGIALCAACLGVGEWVAAGCALSCAWSGGDGRYAPLLEPESQARHRRTANAGRT